MGRREVCNTQPRRGSPTVFLQRRVREGGGRRRIILERRGEDRSGGDAREEAPTKAPHSRDGQLGEEDDGEDATSPALETPSGDRVDDDARKGSKIEGGASDGSETAASNAPWPALDDHDKEDRRGNRLDPSIL